MTHAVYINRIAAFLPHEPVSNEQMEQRLGMVGSRPSRARRLILRSNGIKQRYYAIDPHTLEPTYTNAQLTAEAVRMLADESMPLDSIDCLVASSSQPDQTMPNHAVMVHGELGNPACEVVSTSGICLCGMSALKYAWMSVALGQSQDAVACGSEVASNLMHARNFAGEYEQRVDELCRQPELAFEKDFLRWMLSDGAGAVRLNNQPNSSGVSLRIDWLDILSFAHELPACMYGGADYVEGKFKGWSRFTAQEQAERSVFAIKQDVKLLNENIVKYTVVRTLQKIMQKREIKAQEIDYFLPHYSSEFFRDRLAEGLNELGLDIPTERWFTNLTYKGNTGSASIFIILDELFHSGRLKNGQKILCYVPESGRFSSAFMQLTVVSHEA